MLRVLRMFPFSQAAIKLQLHGGALRRGVGGDRRLRLFSLPPRRLRRGETHACGKEQQVGRAHLARQCASGGKSSLGARLRTRKVTGRDASLPAPLLAASLGLVGRGTVGALPQTPQGTLSLDPARGRRKGTKSPLDPFSRLSWSRFHAPSACSFLVLRLSPCLLPQLSVKNQ